MLYGLLKEWVGEVQLPERAEACPFFWKQINRPEGQQLWETAVSDRPRKERHNTQGRELELKQRNSNIPVRTGADRQVSEGTRRCFQSARGDWAICCNSEVIELTEGKHRRNELSTNAKWAGGKYRLALFYYSILPSYIVFSLFWKLIVHILIKADFLSSKFCDFLGAACNKKVLRTSFQSCSWLRVLSRW